MPAVLGPRSTKRCKYRQKLFAERWPVVLSVLLLPWLARVLRGPCFFRWFSGLLARPQPQNAAIYGVLLHLRFRPGLRAAPFGLLFLGLLARARDPMSAFWVGARMGPRKPASPALFGVKVGNMHNLTCHIIAHAAFLMQKHDMTWCNFKEAWPAQKIHPYPITDDHCELFRPLHSGAPGVSHI